jgi:hypothetical protein
VIDETRNQNAMTVGLSCAKTPHKRGSSSNCEHRCVENKKKETDGGRMLPGVLTPVRSKILEHLILEELMFQIQDKGGGE